MKKILCLCLFASILSGCTGQTKTTQYEYSSVVLNKDSDEGSTHTSFMFVPVGKTQMPMMYHYKAASDYYLYCANPIKTDGEDVRMKVKKVFTRIQKSDKNAFCL